MRNQTQLISDSSLIILPCWLPCKTLPNRFIHLLRMHIFHTPIHTHIYRYLYRDCHCTLFWQVFWRCTHCWQMEIDVRQGEGRVGQTMHPISPENEDNPKSVCRLAPWQFVNQLHVYGVYSKLFHVSIICSACKQNPRRDETRKSLTCDAHFSNTNWQHPKAFGLALI